MIRVATSALLLLAAVSASPLWLRPEAPLVDLTSRRAMDETYLLPKALIPSMYTVSLIPILKDNAPRPDHEFKFTGVITITLTCSEATDKIVMHAFDIVIADKSDIEVVVKGTSEPLGVKSMDPIDTEKDGKQFLTITMDQPLEVATEYEVKITYAGNLNTDLDGFYRSSYMENGEEKFMAVTQFESTGARRAFPCFDEPGMKAIFKIKIARSEGYTILGNMPIVKEDEVVDPELLPGWTYVEFGDTEIMSSYLVAFSVSRFSNLGKETVDTIDFDVWARPNAVETGKYANDMAPKVVKFMTDFTGIRYPMPKIDQIAVPDFAAGAMENWGLVTYRETALLYDETKASETNKQRVAAVVTHELAHQWFGNLVSPKWWSNLWLNEGFATYFEYHASNIIEDTWKMDEQFIYEQLHTALESDALESTHPIISEVDKPSTIDAIFDDVSYNKGGCMVRLLVNLLGEDTFRSGIHTYLKNNEYNNADADALWAGLQTVVPEDFLPAGMTLKNVMDTWTLQSGYPVINVERLYDEHKRAIITQKRFLTLPDPEITHSEKWVVPLTMTNQVENDFTKLAPDAWLTESTMVIENITDNDNWVIFNLMQVGFFRVNYDEENWSKLASYLNSADNFGNVHVNNRAQLINDALSLARSNHVSYPKALDMTNYLQYETEYLPWATAFSSLEFINDRLVSEEESLNYFEQYLLNRLMNTYNSLGGFTIPENEEHVPSITRSMVLKWACQLGYESCNTDAAAIFNEWQAKPNPDTDNPVHANLKSVVYCSGMKLGDTVAWDFLFDRYVAAFETATEQALILSALGCSSDVEVLKAYLAKSIMDNSEIRSQDVRTVLSSVYNNPIGVDIALDFLIENFVKLQGQMGGFSSVARVFSGISSKLNTQEQLAKMEKFYEDNGSSLGGVEPSVMGAIKTIKENINWQTEHKQVVVDHLRSSATLAIVSPLLILLVFVTKLFN